MSPVGYIQKRRNYELLKKKFVTFAIFSVSLVSSELLWNFYSSLNTRCKPRQCFVTEEESTETRQAEWPVYNINRKTDVLHI